MPGQAADVRSIGPTRSPARVMRLRGSGGDGKFTVLAIFLPPALLLFTLFVVVPIGEAAWYSGFNWNGFGRPTNWIGLDNYRFVLETRAFWLALRNNGLIILVSLLIQLPLALALALMLAERFRGAVALRMLFFLPYILAEIATGLIFSFVYDGDYGLDRGNLAPVRRRGAAPARQHANRDVGGADRDRLEIFRLPHDVVYRGPSGHGQKSRGGRADRRRNAGRRCCTMSSFRSSIRRSDSRCSSPSLA